jgi:hypothetical protein
MASFVTFIADGVFHQHSREEQKKRWRTNPANSIVYSALQALEEQSIVRVFETLKDEHKLHPHDAEIRRKEDLEGHRNSISHPMTVVWRKASMQAFADARRDGYDWRAAQIWDVQRSINEELRKRGLETYNETIPVTLDMAASLHLILDLARLPEHVIPPVDLLLAYLQGEAPKYQAILEKHPDGKRDLEMEKKRAERRKARAERWATEKQKAATGAKE